MKYMTGEFKNNTDADVVINAVQKNNIDPIPEHDPKYNVQEDRLKEANEKMKNMSAAQKILESTAEKRTDVEIKGEKLLHKRTPQDYNKIWRAFVNTEIDDYAEYMGYGERVIKKIGINKFIDAMDWKNMKDVVKWRTDKMHIVPCCHCQSDFAIYEEMALCDKCVKLYDMPKLTAVMAAVEKDKPGSAWQQRLIFINDTAIRSMYLKDNAPMSKSEARRRRIQNENIKKEAGKDGVK